MVSLGKYFFCEVGPTLVYWLFWNTKQKTFLFNFKKGAYIFILIELPAEEIRRQTKLTKNLDVDDAVLYLRETFWRYLNSGDRNYTQMDFIDEVDQAYIIWSNLMNFL